MRSSSLQASPRVYLVAEDEDDREMYFVGLEIEGFAVMCSGVDSDVTAVAKAMAPAVIVLVLEHADNEDWDRARALHECPGTQDIPLVIVTAAVRPDAANRRTARRLGNCAAFLAKPCDHCTLAGTVRRVIAGQRNIEEIDHPGTFE